MRRYNRAPLIKGGKQFGTYSAGANIRAGVESGALSYKSILLQDGERLDTVAGREYGDSNLWWIIAGASAIGWSLQVPPGTLIIVPTNLGQVYSLVA